MKIVDYHSCPEDQIEAGNILVDSLMIEFLNEKNLDSFIGNTYLITHCYNDFGRAMRKKAVLRIDGYELCRGSLRDRDYLTPRGFKYCRSIYDRDNYGNHIYAYEKSKVYDTLQNALKEAKKYDAWIEMRMVHCVYDKRREPFIMDIEVSEISPATITQLF